MLIVIGVAMRRSLPPSAAPRKCLANGPSKIDATAGPRRAIPAQRIARTAKRSAAAGGIVHSIVQLRRETMQPLNRRHAIVGTAAALAQAPRASAQTAADAPAHALAFKSAREQAAALAARKISSAELVEQSIGRIEQHDAKLNAVVVRDFERARKAAREADAALARGDRRPLLGVPMTVKESFHVAGLPTTWGIAAAKDFRARVDAVAVQRLKAAGAVILGKTNVPLVLGDMQSYNDIYGTTRNPWDLSRSPGGSSGGSAAALAAGYVALELGSDIGGSLRVPAHFCGVCAHKPSYGVGATRGHTPPGIVEPIPYDVDLAVIGPMARSADDLALALDLIADLDEPMATAYRLALPAPRRTALRDHRVLVLGEHPSAPTSRDVRQALEQVASNLSQAGVKVSRSSALLPDLALQARTHVRLLLSVFGADHPDAVYARLQDAAKSLRADDGSLSAEQLRGQVLSHRDWIRADRERAILRQRWRALFREFDVVLCPVAPTVAFPHDHGNMVARRLQVDDGQIPYADQLVWPSVATTPGLPATAMPIGRSPQGLPIGMQIVGPFLEDRTALAFAALFEREFGGFVPPPGYGG
jgi:amidase